MTAPTSARGCGTTCSTSRPSDFCPTPIGPATFLCRNPSLNSASFHKGMEGAVEERTKYSRLLADSELRRWYDNVDEVTAEDDAL